MTEKQLQQIRAQLPDSEELVRMYMAFEGGIRAISRDAQGRERRYSVNCDAQDKVTITRM